MIHVRLFAAPSQKSLVRKCFSQTTGFGRTSIKSTFASYARAVAGVCAVASLIEFGRFAAKHRKAQELGKLETFNFLGFTFICGKSRKGKFLVKRKTRRDRMRAKLVAVTEELRRRMHQPIPVVGKWLERVVKGYFNYHAVPTNGPALHVFRHHITDLWRRTMRRRSQKDRMTWDRMTQLVNDWLPKPCILHPWPSDRFAVTHPRWEPYAGKPHVRICAGGAR